MHRHTSATRQFYQAFYHWSLLTSPALEHRTCSRIHRRKIGTVGRKLHQDRQEDAESVEKDVKGFKIQRSGKRSGLVHKRPLTFHLDEPQQEHIRDSSPGQDPDLHNPSTPAPQEDDTPWRAPPTWGASHAQSLRTKPSHSLGAWEQVVRHRSHYMIRLEMALPAKTVLRISSRYGKRMAGLTGENGAVIRLGEQYETAGGKALRLVLLSGRLRDVGKVVHVFEEFGRGEVTLEGIRRRVGEGMSSAPGSETTSYLLPRNTQTRNSLPDLPAAGPSTLLASSSRRQSRTPATFSSSRPAMWSFMAATAIPPRPDIAPMRAYSTGTKVYSKRAWHVLEPKRGESWVEGWEFSRNLPMPTAVVRYLQKKHGQDLKNLVSWVDEREAVVVADDEEFEGLCHIPGGPPPPKTCAISLTNVYIAAKELQTCKNIVTSLQKRFKGLTAVIIGLQGEAAVEALETVTGGGKKLLSYFSRPVVSEQELDSKDIKMGTFVLRRRPQIAPVRDDSPDGYFRAASATQIEQIDSEWVLETVLPQVQWDHLEQNSQGGVQAMARKFGIQVQVAEEGFEAPVPGQPLRVVKMRSARLVGMLEPLEKGCSWLGFGKNSPEVMRALGETAEPTAASTEPARRVRDKVKISRELSGPKSGFERPQMHRNSARVLSTLADAVPQVAEASSQTPTEPTAASTEPVRRVQVRDEVKISRVLSGPDSVSERPQMSKGSAQPLNTLADVRPRSVEKSSQTPTEPEIVTTRLRIAGDTTQSRASNTGKLIGHDGRTITSIRQETGCKILRMGAKEDGLFEVSGPLENVRRATRRIQDLVGTQRLSTDEEVAMLKALEQKMQDEMKLILRPLTHPVVIITSLMPKHDMEPEDSRDLMKRYRGVTVSSFNTVTLGNPGPPLVSFNLKVPSRTWEAIRRARNMCVHILSATPTAAATAQLFTRPYDAPEEPFKLLHQAGGFTRGWGDSPRICMAGVVLARLRARVMLEKCVRVADHVVVVAKVQDVEFARDVVKEGGDGFGKVEEAEARRLVEEATGLGYARRGYRGLGEEVDAGELPRVREWRDEVVEGKRSEGGELGEDDGGKASRRLGASANYSGASTAQDQSGDASATSVRQAMGGSPLERTGQETISTTQPSSDADSPEAVATSDLAKTQRKAAQEEEDDYDLGFVRKTADRLPEIQDEMTDILGTAQRDSAPRRRNESLLPHQARSFSAVSGRRSYSTATLTPLGTAGSKDKETTTTKPITDCVTDPSLLTQSIDEFLGLPPTKPSEVPPMRNLLRAQKNAAAASTKLESALADGSLTAKESLELESEITSNERKVAKQLAYRANADLKRMLDTGTVDLRRVGWMEQSVERGMVGLQEEMRMLNEMFDKGDVGEEVFARVQRKLQLRQGELEEGLVRLRGVVEDEDD